MDRLRHFDRLSAGSAQGGYNGEGPCRCKFMHGKALHKYLCIYKPGFVSTLRRTSTIYLGRWSPIASIGLPSGMRLAPQGRTIHAPCGASGIHGLSAREVYQATPVTRNAGGLLPHLFTLATPLRRFGGLPFCGTFCGTTLTVIPLPVRKHGALRCPDFPPLPRTEKAVERCTGCQ
jgi:hypothetical protein